VVSWLIFDVAHSLHIDLDMLVVRALKISQLTPAVCLLLMTRCTSRANGIRPFLRAGLKPSASSGS